MKNIKLTLLFFSLMLAVSACQFFGSKLEKGTLVSLEELPGILGNKENEGKRFAVEGYPYLSGTNISLNGDGKTLVSIYDEPLGEGERIAIAYMMHGESKNSFYVPEEFSDEDLVLFDAEGNKLAFDEKAMFSFTAEFTEDTEDVLGGATLLNDVRVDAAVENQAQESESEGVASEE